MLTWQVFVCSFFSASKLKQSLASEADNRNPSGSCGRLISQEKMDLEDSIFFMESD